MNSNDLIQNKQEQGRSQEFATGEQKRGSVGRKFPSGVQGMGAGTVSGQGGQTFL